MTDYLKSRDGRLNIKEMDYPHWDRIEEGRHVGYRRGKTGASWFARIRFPNGQYHQEHLGEADDTLKADGQAVLSYEQARIKAILWLKDLNARGIKQNVKPARTITRLRLPAAPPYLVAHAVIDYLTWFKENRRSFRDVNRVCHKEILPVLGNIPLDKLHTKDIRRWLDELVERPTQIRVTSSRSPKFRPKQYDNETKRKRQCTANRQLGMLKAVLNRAYEYGYVDDDLQWRRVRRFRNVEKCHTRFFTIKELHSILKACPIHLKRLVIGAALSGCRINELRNMRVGDYVESPMRVVVKDSKNGKSRYISLSKEGGEFFGKLTTNRPAEELMFLREKGIAWSGNIHQARFYRVCNKAGIEPPVKFHALRHTYATQAIMAGIPLQIVAQQLGHSDTRMVERYYAHLAPSFIDEMVQKMMPRLIGKALENW